MQKILGKPESNSDVLNKHPKTLLIGYGWVGQQVHKYFTEADYYTPDTGLMNKNHEKIQHPQEAADFMENYADTPVGNFPKRFVWEIGFISVPTPMKEDGSCDLSYVESAVKQWYDLVHVFIIRSTVTPGTIERLQAICPKNLFVMQPEYLGETLGHPMLDVDRRTFVILGGTTEATNIAARAWQSVLHSDCKIRQVDGKTAEICKYMENCFLATKIMFVNQFRELCEAVGVDFLTLREAWLDDPRIGRSHTFAFKDNPGFSGKCLPKDLNSIAHYARDHQSPMLMIENILKLNATMRANIESTVPLLPVKPLWRD